MSIFFPFLFSLSLSFSSHSLALSPPRKREEIYIFFVPSMKNYKFSIISSSSSFFPLQNIFSLSLSFQKYNFEINKKEEEEENLETKMEIYFKSTYNTIVINNKNK